MQFIYQKITDMIIQKLEKGVVPWQKTWDTAYPKNFVSGLDYRGINIMLLGMQDYESNYWLTFNQCKQLGGSVKKGSESSLVVFWKPIVRITEKELDDSTADVHFLLRYYYVFNLNQVILPDEVLQKKNIIQNKPTIMEAEQVIQNYKNPPEITINNLIPNPRYLPRLDKVEIQSISHFNTNSDYYASLYHELIHSTGSLQRLARKGITAQIEFGSENYSKEELIAEIGASYLCNITGIQKTIDNQSSYIDSWLKVLNNDNKMILIAASQSQKACDYILNITKTNQQEN